MTRALALVPSVFLVLLAASSTPFGPFGIVRAEPSDNVKREATGVFDSSNVVSAWKFTCCKTATESASGISTCTTFCDGDKGNQEWYKMYKDICDHNTAQTNSCMESGIDREKPLSKFTTITKGEMDSDYTNTYIVTPAAVCGAIGLVFSCFLLWFQCCMCGRMGMKGKSEDDACSVRACICCLGINLCCSSKQFRKASFFVGFLAFLTCFILVCVGFSSVDKINKGFDEFASGADDLNTWSQASKSQSATLKRSTADLFSALNALHSCSGVSTGFNYETGSGSNALVVNQDLRLAKDNAFLLKESASSTASTMDGLDVSSFSGDLKDAIKGFADVLSTAFTFIFVFILVLAVLGMFFLWGGSQYASEGMNSCVQKGCGRCITSALPITMFVCLIVAWAGAVMTNILMKPYADFCMAPEAMMLSGFGDRGEDSRPDALLYYYSFCDEQGSNYASLRSPFASDKALQESYDSLISGYVPDYNQDRQTGTGGTGQACWDDFHTKYPKASHQNANQDFSSGVNFGAFYSTVAGCEYVSPIIDKFLGDGGLCGSLFAGFQEARDAFLGLGICLIFAEYCRAVLMTDIERTSGDAYQEPEP